MKTAVNIIIPMPSLNDEKLFGSFDHFECFPQIEWPSVMIAQPEMWTIFSKCWPNYFQLKRLESGSLLLRWGGWGQAACLKSVHSTFSFFSSSPPPPSPCTQTPQVCLAFTRALCFWLFPRSERYQRPLFVFKSSWLWYCQDGRPAYLDCSLTGRGNRTVNTDQSLTKQNLNHFSPVWNNFSSKNLFLHICACRLWPIGNYLGGLGARTRWSYLDCRSGTFCCRPAHILSLLCVWYCQDFIVFVIVLLGEKLLWQTIAYHLHTF